jgi:hypothetical protein
LACGHYENQPLAHPQYPFLFCQRTYCSWFEPAFVRAESQPCPDDLVPVEVTFAVVPFTVDHLPPNPLAESIKSAWGK